MAKERLVSPDPALTLVEDEREQVASVPGRFSSRRRREPHPVERLLREGLGSSLYRQDIPLLLDHLGSLARWDEGDCRRIEREMASRWVLYPAFNERFVSDQLARVGGNGVVGTRVRGLWIADRLDRFTADAHAVYRRYEHTLSSTHLAFLRALYVSCVMHANVGPVHDALSQTRSSRQPGPYG